jgi:hypothetical protein
MKWLLWFLLALPVCAQNAPSHGFFDSTAALVLDYSSGDTLDWSAISANATLSGFAMTLRGFVTNNSNSGYIDLGTQTYLDTATNFTIHVWTLSDTANTNHGFIDKSSGLSYTKGFSSAFSLGKYQFFWNAVGVPTLTCQSVVSNGWHLFSMACTPTNFFIYVDGLPETGYSGTLWPSSSGISLRLGQRRDSTTLSWIGGLGRSEIWQRTASDADVLQYYELTRPLYTSGVSTNTYQFNKPWTVCGTVLQTNAVFEESTVSEPTVIYTNTSGAFLWTMYYTVGWTTSSTRYATSTDGKNWTKQGIVVNNSARNFVYLAATNDYRMITSPYPAQDKLQLCGSPNGTNSWGAVTNILSLGGAWESQNIANSCVIMDGGKHKMLYEAKGAGNVWAIGYADSTDGTNWVKYAFNPVISATGSVGGPFWWKGTNGVYYALVHAAPTGVLPTDVYKWASPNGTTSWARVSSYPYLQRYAQDEGAGLSTGQVADPNVACANGTNYFYLSTSSNGTAASGNQHIKLWTNPGNILDDLP